MCGGGGGGNAVLHKILTVHEFICKVCEIVHYAYELLLKTICNIRSAKSAMDLYFYN